MSIPMKNPPHPGHSIKDACLEPLELSVTDGARLLGVTRHTLSRVINGHSGISPEMAVRLEKVGWSNADHWLSLQSAYELAQVDEDRIHVERYRPPRRPRKGRKTPIRVLSCNLERLQTAEEGVTAMTKPLEPLAVAVSPAENARAAGGARPGRVPGWVR